MGLAERPLALTLGDPAGIGPDITLLAWLAREHEQIPAFVLLGDASVLATRAEALGLRVPIATVADTVVAEERFGEELPVISIAVAGTVVPGRPNDLATSSVQRSIEKAVRLVQAGEARAVVTNPISKVMLAVTGLNPHAGEEGELGREEIDIIQPAIEAARNKGLEVTGPYPADTLFHAGARASYDVAICMYHDQALVPLKTLAFDEGVNITLGLPFVRTSPDHGTAFTLAGTGKANPRSLIEALRLADALSRHAERHAREHA
jgi:4-hydroxy-L-threonine phosphate dehydrogenase PdxA